MKRRIFSILIALALCLGLLPLRAFAADAPVNNPVLDISEGGIFISKDTKGSDLCAYRQIKSDGDLEVVVQPYSHWRGGHYPPSKRAHRAHCHTRQ